MPTKRLCEHVRVRRTGPGGYETKGICSSVMLWNKKLMADVPAIKCTMCGATLHLTGIHVRKAR